MIQKKLLKSRVQLIKNGIIKIKHGICAEFALKMNDMNDCLFNVLNFKGFHVLF